ncbi:hypothetical protein TorRG33x02_076760 [Trema orientale]|uniref:Uncharacterized protein n=1 Tax=Trema orientale TaxID=63057 RepID=A0A2P5FF36_TREOI|nr:hypothetical protein TorRG33x02_076760 [Trema orientale]
MEQEIEISMQVDEIKEITNEVENISFHDLSISLKLDIDGARDTISKSPPSGRHPMDYYVR